ncbi:hypothetical protein TIFTF001_020702 [Ficus carica]|uniref:Uncharacterized protein n=1 Tax=Ficus carica TaxID=3494 RepID=A0AA88DA18_FICCA|nr:hypothetical protein TIFTF001_020702 [Ficus carica]
MEVESYPFRGQEEFLESPGNQNRAAKVPELATSVELLSGSRHQNVSSLGPNSRVIEEASMTGRTTTASKSVLFVERVIANPADSTQEGRFITAEVEDPSGLQQQNVPIAAAKSRVAEDKERATPMTDQMTTASNSRLSVGEIAGNEENPPADSCHDGHDNAMEVFNSAIRCQDGVQESTGNADDNEKEPERAAVAAELPSGSQHQNVSNSAEDHTVDEEIDPVKMFSKPALCPKDVNNESKISRTRIQVLREIPGIKLEARIQRLERILKYLKKTR